jgi:phosphate transport system permease protein
MSPILLILCLAALSIGGFYLARARAVRLSGGDIRSLASLPGFYGQNAAYAALIPALALLLVGGLMNRLARGSDLLSFWTSLTESIPGVLSYAALGVSVIGLALALRAVSPGFRSRVAAERWVLSLLIAAASIAIFTTAAIVLSMIFETQNFFSQYSWTEFIFGITWAPDFRGNSSLGILPLLWGTLYI